jgi:tocopherol cyclase
MFKKIHAFFNPEEFRGWGKRRNYFEGWYFKLVSSDEDTALAIIPGIAMDKQGDGHAFIQVLDGKAHTSFYHKFPITDFVPTPNRFLIKIGNNIFSEKQMELDLQGISGQLSFSGNIGWPKPIYSPGIMGPYSFAPFMECYHGIVSIDHRIDGKLFVNSKGIEMNGGRGYLEKDWGRSFPSAYFWMQSNHFNEPGISFKCSVAKIPWLSGAFVGFIAGLWIKDRLYRFTTYNSTKLKRSFADQDRVEIMLENKNYRLEVVAHRDQATALASPIRGFMNGKIEESMTSRIDLLLIDKKKNAPVFQQQGRNAGLEVAGKISEIFVG